MIFNEDGEDLLRGGFNPNDSDFYENLGKMEQLYRWMKYKPRFALKAIYETMVASADWFSFYWDYNMNLSDVRMKGLKGRDNVRALRLSKTLQEGDLCDLQEVIENLYDDLD